jgi:hypothetical protein
MIHIQSSRSKATFFFRTLSEKEKNLLRKYLKGPKLDKPNRPQESVQIDNTDGERLINNSLENNNY